MTVSASKLSGQGKVTLPEEVFGERFHEPVVHEAVRAERLAARRGTAATKSRGQVRGGGAKPWRQKGTGRARIGSIRAPHWEGGGVAFGPTPRSYTVKTNRKARRRALRAALSIHAERGSISVVDAKSFDEPSAKRAAAELAKAGSQLPAVVLLSEDEVGCAKSFRNLDRVFVLEVHEAGVVDIFGAASLVLSESALEALVKIAAEVKD
jgi:large subunit ribosomal protein L4